jgi:hypothetical protein
MFSTASLDCGKGPPTSWVQGNLQLVDPGSSNIESCHNTSIICKNSGLSIVVIGVASGSGTDTSESPRALQRGVNLASVLKKDFRESCKMDASVYVLNLGRYNGKDDPTQRRVTGLIGTGSGDDEAVATALEKYLKSHSEFDNYTVCDLYKLKDGGEQSPIQPQHKICDKPGTTVSQQ